MGEQGRRSRHVLHANSVGCRGMSFSELFEQQISLDGFLVSHPASRHAMTRFFAYFLLNVKVIRFLTQTFTEPQNVLTFCKVIDV